MAESQPNKLPFFVYAPDYTDEEAFNRRLSVREQHIAGVKALNEQGIMSKLLIATFH